MCGYARGLNFKKGHCFTMIAKDNIRKLFKILVLFAVIFALKTGLTGEIQRANNIYRGKLVLWEDLKPQRITLAGDAPKSLASLEYDGGQLPYVYADDLNKDGYKDYFLGSHQGKLCGTAGCPYTLLDGKSLRVLGEFFGNIAILDNKINAFPVIQILSKRDIIRTNLQTFVYDGQSYREVSYALLEESGVNQWRRHLLGLP